MKNILITGGSGLVGTRLSKLLIAKGYHVGHLTRGKVVSNDPEITNFQWNINKQTIDPEALQFADIIIHLAGAGVVEKRWSPERKKEILNSRVMSTRLLYTALANQKHHVECLVSASAIGIYGADTGHELMHEQSAPSDEFLANVVVKWEDEVNKISGLNIRTTLLRIGIVLANEGGALPQMVTPVKWWLGSPLGSGDQIVSWIHIDDLCNIFLFAIENQEMNGIFNAVAPSPVANTELMQTIARKLHKPLFMPNVPSFVMKFLLGEMAEVVLGGNKVSARKIIKAGFKFKYPELSLALKNLLVKKNG